MNQNYLYYFGVRGTADAIRLVLHEIKLQFEEVSLSPNDFLSSKSNFEFHSLPCWKEIVNGKEQVRVSFSSPILHHLARKGNLFPSEEPAIRQCEMWEEELRLVQEDLWHALLAFESAQQPENVKQDYFEKSLLNHLQRLSKRKQTQNSSYLIGNKPMFVDFLMFSFLDCVNQNFPLALPAFPLLEKHYHLIEERFPKQFLTTRP